MPKEIKNQNVFRDQGEAVAIKVASTESYAEIIKKMKEKINPADIGVEIKAIRRTNAGELLFKLSKGEDQAEKLKNAISQSLGKDINVRTVTNNQFIDIRDMDEATGESELLTALQEATKSENLNPFKVLNIRESYGQTRQALVQLPGHLAANLIQMNRIKIGWVMCRIRVKERTTKCFRCLEQFHTAKDCQGKDRTELCRKCGKKGHKAKECTGELNCILCQDAGVQNTKHYIGRRGREAQDLMMQKASETHTDILLISEPYKKPATQTWYEDKRHGAAIMLRNNTLTVRDICQEHAGFVYATIGQLRIYSCYIPPSLDFPTFVTTIQNLENSIRDTKHDVVIGGDFNSKSPEWNSSSLDNRGTTVCEFIASPRANRTYNEHMNWKVLEDITLSDHQYITFKIYNYEENSQQDIVLPKWNVRKLDTRKLTQFIRLSKEKNANWRIENETPQNAVQSLSKILTKGCNISMPKSKTYKNKSPVYWWNNEIRDLRRICNTARRAATRNYNNELLKDNYKKARKTLKIAIRDSKKKCWQELCSDIDTNPWGKPYKIVMKKFGTMKPIPGIKEESWATKIVETLFPTDENEENNVSSLPPGEYSPLCLEEVKTACMKLKKSKSPGPDGVPNEVLQVIGNVWPELIVDTFNICLKHGFFPIKWKIQKLVLLLKGGKPLDQPSSYRPLCMLDSIGKLFEIVILKRLESEIEKLGGLSNSQYGFRKGRSTVDAISEMTTFKTEHCYTKQQMALKNIRLRLECHRDLTRTFLWNVMYDDLLNMELQTGRKINRICGRYCLVMTNHGDFNQYLHRFGLRSSPLCDTWQWREATARHMLFIEPYKKPATQTWYEDKRHGAAIMLRNNTLTVRDICQEHAGFVYATIGQLRIYSCYIPPSLDFPTFKARKTLKIAIRDSKKKCWQELCSDIDTNPWGKPYKIVMKKFGTMKPIPGIKEESWATKIVETLFPTDENEENNVSSLPPGEYSPLCLEEVKTACMKLKKSKSPGPDGVPNEVLQVIGNVWPELIVDTFNICLKHGFFPIKWKIQKLVLLLKGGKPLDQPSSYRPLCMLDSIGKLFEIVILKRLESEIEKLGGLSNSQYGFRKGRSTVDAISEVTNIATKAKITKQFCAIITLDVRNAFQ
ncbi:Retrovirus-related Pol polyprotein from type-1 retrotransposable element R1 [Lucilia cuprina]|nr:Retrovirus-related Pol polyprotein from type-1 retrotransposable element R1 [Lucilia cuprina]